MQFCCQGKVYVINNWEDGQASVHCDLCGKLLKEFRIERCYQGGKDSCPVEKLLARD